MAELDAAVLAYLRRRGYAGTTLEALKKDPKMTSAAAPVADLGSNPSLQNRILFYSTEEAHPRRYFDSYLRLRDWVHSSLDLYKNELARVLYPVFVHCFLDLVEASETALSREFFATFRGDHESLHSAELARLQGLSSPEHLASNDQAHIFREHKFHLRLCEYSFDVLLRFLHGQDFMLLLSVLNDRVTFKVSGVKPDPLVEEDESMLATITGTAPSQTSATNRIKGRWGVLDSAPQRKVHTLVVDAAAAKAAAEETEKPTKRGKRNAAPAVSSDPVVAAAQTALAALPAVQSEVPVPLLPEKSELQVLDELRRRVTLTAAALPSVCLYTFHHTAAALNCATVSSDAALVAGGFADSSVRVWDFDQRPAQPSASEAAEAAPDKRLSASPSRAGSKGGAASVGGALNVAAQATHRFVGHSAPVYAVDVSPDGGYVFSASADKTIRLWNLELKTNLVAYKNHNYPVWDVRCSPVGHYFASASHDRTARVWAVDQADPLRIMAGHLSDVDCVRWHPNCNYIATGSSDKTVRLWDVQTGECVRLFTGHHTTIYSLAMSPDGRTMASGAADGTVLLWDLGSSRKLGALSGHTAAVWDVAYSGCGNVLASGGADNTLRLWDVNALEVTERQRGSAAAAAADKGTGPRFGSCLKSLGTKSTPVVHVKFTHRNLLLGAGAKQ